MHVSDASAGQRLWAAYLPMHRLLSHATAGAPHLVLGCLPAAAAALQLWGRRKKQRALLLQCCCACQLEPLCRVLGLGIKEQVISFAWRCPTSFRLLLHLPHAADTQHACSCCKPGLKSCRGSKRRTLLAERLTSNQLRGAVEGRVLLIAGCHRQDGLLSKLQDRQSELACALYSVGGTLGVLVVASGTCAVMPCFGASVLNPPTDSVVAASS